MSTPSAVPAAAEPQKTSRGPQIIIVIGVVLLVTLFMVFYAKGQAKSVTARMTAYELKGSNLSVTFEVNKAYIAEATCSIVALDFNSKVIGRVDGYVVGPQNDHHRVTTHTVDIPVKGTPVTGRVDSCVITRDH